jgi:hypothetical protein
MNRAPLYRILLVIGFVALSTAVRNAAAVRRITLTEAVRLDNSENHALNAARLKVVENEQKKFAECFTYFNLRQAGKVL